MPAVSRPAAAAAVVVVLSLAACAAGPTYHTESKPGASPAAHATYGWLHHARPDDGVSSLLGSDFGRIVAEAADAELAAKGYRASGQPELLVNWHLVLRQMVETERMADFYGYGPGWRTWAARTYPSAVAPVSTDRANEGTLVVDVLLADSKELIWRGFGTAPIDESVSIPERQGRVARAVREVVSQIPESGSR